MEREALESRRLELAQLTGTPYGPGYMGDLDTEAIEWVQAMARHEREHEAQNEQSKR